MSYHPTSSRPDRIGAGESADEIEITPEMAMAGALAWAKGDDAFDSPEEIAKKIYREMTLAKRRECGA
jgi:hypothetical protein